MGFVLSEKDDIFLECARAAAIRNNDVDMQRVLVILRHLRDEHDQLAFKHGEMVKRIEEMAPCSMCSRRWACEDEQEFCTTGMFVLED